MKILIKRFKQSLNPYRDPNVRSWSNNDANNSLDMFEVFEYDEMIFRSMCQTVSNTEGIIPGCRYSDTIAPGKFKIVLFQAQRKFHCDVHGIMDATTIGGERIGKSFCTPSSTDRHLVHDWQKLSPQPAGTDTRVAWSGGCIILPTKRHAELSRLFRGYGMIPGDVIDVELVEC